MSFLIELGLDTAQSSASAYFRMRISLKALPAPPPPFCRSVVHRRFPDVVLSGLLRTTPQHASQHSPKDGVSFVVGGGALPKNAVNRTAPSRPADGREVANVVRRGTPGGRTVTAIKGRPAIAGHMPPAPFPATPCPTPGSAATLCACIPVLSG